jgi:hypothetical protein
MVSNVPTDREKSIVTRLARQSCSAVPGCKVRFVRRVQEPGEQGLLLGIQLPPELRTTSNQVLTLQDICEAQSREHNLPIGLTVSQPAGTVGLIDLAFLPREAIAPIPANNTGAVQSSMRTVAITAAVAVLLLLIAFMARQPRIEVAGTSDHSQQKPAQKSTLVIARPQSNSETPQMTQAAHRPEDEANRPTDPTEHSTPVLAPELPTPTIPPSGNAFLIPKTNGSWPPQSPQGTGLPAVPTLNPPPPRQIPGSLNSPLTESANDLDWQRFYQKREPTGRQQALNELSRYSSLLRSQGKNTEADQVQKMILELP